MHYYKIEGSSLNESKVFYYICSEIELKADAEGYVPLPISLVEKLFADEAFIDKIEEIEYDEWVKNQIEN